MLASSCFADCCLKGGWDWSYRQCVTMIICLAGDCQNYDMFDTNLKQGRGCFLLEQEDGLIADTRHQGVDV